MIYWPLSALADSPCFPWQFAAEVHAVRHRGSYRLSEPCVNALGNLALNTPPREIAGLCATLALDAPSHYQFLGYPSFDDWMALERTAVIHPDETGIFVKICTLH